MKPVSHYGHETLQVGFECPKEKLGNWFNHTSQVRHAVPSHLHARLDLIIVLGWKYWQPEPRHLKKVSGLQ